MTKTVYLDTETTGLDADRDELVEVAIIDDQGRALVDTLLKPQNVTAWPGAEAIHGISPDDVANAPTLGEVMPAIVAAVKGKRVVIYNRDFFLPFLPFVERAAAGVSCCMASFDWGYTSLENAAQRVDYTWDGPKHRAANDARACRFIWRRTLEAFEERERQRKRDFLKNGVRRAVDSAINRLELAESKRLLRAQEKSARVIERFYLRQNGEKHWLTTSATPLRELAVLFFGEPGDLPGEFYESADRLALPVYRKQKDIPDDLAPKSWFPQVVAFQRLLNDEKPAAAYVGPKSHRYLYRKALRTEIYAAHPFDFPETRPRYYTETRMRRELKMPRAFTHFLKPVTWLTHPVHHFTYPIYDADAVDKAWAQWQKEQARKRA